MSPPTHKSLPSLIQKSHRSPVLVRGALPRSGWDSAQAGSLIGQGGVEAQRAPSSLPAGIGAARLRSLCLPCVCEVWQQQEQSCREREANTGGWHRNPPLPTSRGARKWGWEAACPVSALSKPHSLIFGVVLFECHHPGSRGALLPCRSSRAAGQTLGPWKSGAGCSVLVESTVATCPLHYLD